MKKILITGCRGQLGKELNRFYEGKKNVEIFNTDVEEMDITDLDSVMTRLKEINPDIVINCAAHTAVDNCETEEELAYKINAIGPRNLSYGVNEVNAILIHISSDYVYDGKKTTPYVEGDSYNPQSVYGKTKLQGEEFVRQIARKFFVIRTAWLYGEGKNFVNSMLKAAEKGNEIRVVCDQRGTPTSAYEVVKVIDALCRSDKYGTYHATCEGECSWYEFARTIFEYTGINAKVEAVTTEEYNAVAERPAYSVLENKELKEKIGYQMAEWHLALKVYLKERNLLKREASKMGNEKKRVLVTGANGYIGRHVVSALLDMGQEVLASDFSFEGVDERAERVEEPIFSGNPNIYKKLGSPDVCIHLAWRNGFVHNHDSHIQDLPEHYIFVKNMIQGGVPQLAVMGTMHEVGYWEGAINESTPTNPISLYGIAKNALRQMAFALAKDSNTTVNWLRAYYILGDDKKSNSIFAKIVRWEEEGKASFPFNSGKNKYDFIDVEELAKQIAAASIQDKVDGIINCCTGVPISLGEKVQEFIEEHNYKIRPEYGAFPDRPYDSPGIWGDATKITEIMNNL